MIDFRWLSDSLCDVLRWQRANPGGEDGPEVPIVGRRVWSIFLGLPSGRAIQSALRERQGPLAKGASKAHE